MLLLLIVGTVNLVHATLYQECAKFFHPNNYLDQLPSLSLPYVNNVAIPNGLAHSNIKPSPVLTTKVINVVTKYVYKNPVCVKYTKKTVCGSINKNKPSKNKMEHLITKEYFVRDSKLLNSDNDDLGLYVQGTEEPRPFSKANQKTPVLTTDEIKEMLIEDRLDQLETVLPQYTRRRVYQTSTITVTKVRSNNRATATLLVKNCMPQGYDLCPPKTKKRKSKVALYSNLTTEDHYFG